MFDQSADAASASSFGEMSGMSDKAKKGTPWSSQEHAAFLRGLERLGRGNWRGISRFFVPTRTPTQVASHAQKHFLRIGGNTKRRSRFAAVEEEMYGSVDLAGIKTTRKRVRTALASRTTTSPSTSSGRMHVGLQSTESLAHLSDGTSTPPSGSTWASPPVITRNATGNTDAQGNTDSRATAAVTSTDAHASPQPTARGAGPGKQAGTRSAGCSGSAAHIAPVAATAVVGAPALLQSTGNVGSAAVVPGYPSGAFFSLPAFNYSTPIPAVLAPSTSHAGGRLDVTTGVFSAAVHAAPMLGAPVTPPTTSEGCGPTSPAGSFSAPRDSSSNVASACTPFRPQAMVAAWRSAGAIATLAPLLVGGLGFTSAVLTEKPVPLHVHSSRTSAFTPLTPAIQV